MKLYTRLLFLFFSFFYLLSYGQVQVPISGDKEVSVGDTSTYSITLNSSAFSISNGKWVLSSGGTILSESSTNLKVKWTSVGSHTINFTGEQGDFSNGYDPSVSDPVEASLVVVVRDKPADPIPATPATPIILSQTSTGAVLERGDPPSGVTWYWQGTNANGTSVSSSNKTFTVTTSGTYYLRAKNATGWSVSSSSVQVTLVNTVPDTPASPVIVSQDCTQAVLKMSTVPSGVTWYWQGTNANGTNTANSNGTYTVTSSGTYYLRSKDSNDNWSVNSSSIAISLESNGTKWYADSDGDGYGDLNVVKVQCNQPEGFVTNSEDCDDSRAFINPLTKWYADSDGDGYGDPNVVKVQCEQPSGYILNSGDQCPDVKGENENGCNFLSNENYVFTRLYRVAKRSPEEITTTEDVIESVVYYDGLGRAKQNVSIGQSSSKKDIVTHIEYDELGRQAKDYLPYVPTVETPLGSYKTDNQVTATNNYYTTHYSQDLNGTHPNPFSEKLFEASPLNRVLEQAAPGESWKVGNSTDSNGYTNGHTIKFDYQTNVANEVRLFKAIEVEDEFLITTIALENQGFYNPSELYKTITKDENWKSIQTNLKEHTTEEFKDKQGRVVLKRTYGQSEGSDNGIHDTYYIYDDYGNLTFVIPPKASRETNITEGILNRLCYQYQYDYRNRLVEKKIPGKGWEYIVYDKLDRPILTQDAKNRNQDHWLFTKYDVFGRVVYTGKVKLESNDGFLPRESLQDIYKNTTKKQYEERLSTAITLTDVRNRATKLLYSNDNFPNELIVSLQELFSINYYDTYDGLDIGNTPEGSNPVNVFNQAVTKNTKTLSVASQTKVLGTRKWITSIVYYDQKARPIYTYSQNDYLNTKDVVKTAYDFMGTVLKTEASHQYKEQPQIITEDSFTYDHVNRLLSHSQRLNDEAFGELVTKNTYDELGQLIVKGVGNKSNNQARLQNIDYQYNIRGWLKKINDTGQSLTGAESKLFAFTINYDAPTQKLSSTPLFNGNISETIWKTANDNVQRGYGYSYDALNRIKKGVYREGASFSEKSNYYDLKDVKYDLNGNIKYLARHGYDELTNNYTVLDELNYAYRNRGQSNRLLRVSDVSNNENGFNDGNTRGNDYSYDINGNLTKDKNKNITKIKYNYLNLPTVVVFGRPNARNKIKYRYDATGSKIEKIVIRNGRRTITHYAGNYVYKNNVLEFFNHPEGYVKNDNGTFNYVYQYKDHLGNVRLSYTDADGNGSIDPYNEIIEESNYYPFGLKHRGYNNVTSPHGNATAQKKGFQEQMFDDELGLNWNTFKYRNYDPSLARFHNIDPLAENFSYQSPYNFSENKVISHFELEGMEAVLAITMGSDVKYRGGIVQKANPSAQHVNLQSGGVNSFVDAFKTASSSDPKGIGFVAIWGHGVPGNIWGSGSSGNTDINNSDLSALNDAIKNGEISFAENAVIYMGNCNAGTCGSSDPRSIAAEISKITGAIVIGGNNSVGLGADGSQVENAESMIYWLYNPNRDSFLEFDNGVQVNSLGGSMDVIKLMNRVMNPVTPASSLTPAGLHPVGQGQQLSYDHYKKQKQSRIDNWNNAPSRLYDNKFITDEKF